MEIKPISPNFCYLERRRRKKKYQLTRSKRRRCGSPRSPASIWIMHKLGLYVGAADVEGRPRRMPSSSSFRRLDSIPTRSQGRIKCRESSQQKKSLILCDITICTILCIYVLSVLVIYIKDIYHQLWCAPITSKGRVLPFFFKWCNRPNFNNIYQHQKGPILNWAHSIFDQIQSSTHDTYLAHLQCSLSLSIYIFRNVKYTQVRSSESLHVAQVERELIKKRRAITTDCLINSISRDLFSLFEERETRRGSSWDCGWYIQSRVKRVGNQSERENQSC